MHNQYQFARSEQRIMFSGLVELLIRAAVHHLALSPAFHGGWRVHLENAGQKKKLRQGEVPDVSAAGSPEGQ